MVDGLNLQLYAFVSSRIAERPQHLRQQFLRTGIFTKAAAQQPDGNMRAAKTGGEMNMCVQHIRRAPACVRISGG